MDIKFCEAFSHITEEEGAVVEMEQGQQSYALLHFHNPMNVIIDGKHFRTDENAYLLLRPYTSYKYFSSSGGFINDYIILKCDESVFFEYEVPLDRIIYLEKGINFDKHFDCITWSLTDVPDNHQDIMEDALFSILNGISEYRLSDSTRDLKDKHMKKQFLQLREQVRLKPYEWSAAKMAKSSYLTDSHFNKVYYRLFGVTPGEDVKNFLIEYAEKLLLETNISIGEIAEQCGYRNTENFIRIFKQKKGITPSKYRKRL